MLAGTAALAGSPCVDEPPCVHVTPDPEVVTAPGTIYVYRGYGWRPRARVSALYGQYCRSQFCNDVGIVTRFRADRRGRFVFRFRYGRFLTPGIPRPAAAGGGQAGILFSTPRTASDAIPPPPPSTPAQRAEARAVARLVADTHRALLARRRAVNRSMARYDRGLDPCQDEFERFPHDTPQDDVIGALIGLWYDESVRRGLLPGLLAYADRLEALDLRDPELRAGADAMVAALRRDDRPYPRPDLCTVIRQWAETGYDMARAPVDARAAETSGELVGEIASSAAIETAGDRLRELGAGAGTQEYWEGAWFNTGEYF